MSQFCFIYLVKYKVIMRVFGGLVVLKCRLDVCLREPKIKTATALFVLADVYPHSVEFINW